MPTGACLCGRVRFSVEGALPAADACHCDQCRAWSGHVWASTDVPKAALRIEGEEHLSWYRSSEKVERGFCARCGSSLFFRPLARDWIGVAMGAFHKPSGGQLGIHIFVSEQGDYYRIADGLPENER